LLWWRFHFWNGAWFLGAVECFLVLFLLWYYLFWFTYCLSLQRNLYSRMRIDQIWCLFSWAKQVLIVKVPKIAMVIKLVTISFFIIFSLTFLSQTKLRQIITRIITRQCIISCSLCSIRRRRLGSSVSFLPASINKKKRGTLTSKI
jgi:hypothetical protein